MKTLKYVLAQTAPLLPSYIFVGLACGMLCSSSGLTLLWTMLSSIFIYAGSMQIVMISLLTGGLSLGTVALMTLFINGRHFFYGLGLVERYKKQGPLRCLYMALTTTDETYSLLCSLKCPADQDEKTVDFVILLFCHLLWIFSCLIGFFFGELLPFDLTGIEFSGTAFFIVVTLNQWKDFGSHIPVMTGFISAVVFWVILGPDKFILPALSVSIIVLIVLKERIQLKMNGGVLHE